MPRYAERAFQVPQRNPNTKLCAQIPRTLSSNTFKKDWEGCTTRKINMTISLAFLAPDLSKRPSMDGFRMAWELPGSPTCLPNGPASARCLASLCCNLTRPVEWSRQRQMPGEIGVRSHPHGRGLPQLPHSISRSSDLRPSSS